MIAWLMKDELEMVWKQAAVACLWYYTRICLEGLRNTTENISRDSRSPGQFLNPKPPEYEAECKLLGHDDRTLCSETTVTV
jgi:hypothetical protein